MSLPSDRSFLPIGIFDSGFGGLTVMRAIRRLLPNENLVYFGDTAHLPYGNKSVETIARYTEESISFLLQCKIKLLVIACHSACSAALTKLQSTCPVPIIGITQQGSEEVIRLSSQGKIAILATRATIHSGVYQQQILSQLPHAEISAIACPLLVPLIEEGYHSHLLTRLAIREYIEPLQVKRIDTMLLGCTHYPLIQDVIQQELEKDVLILDPAHACAAKIGDFLHQKGLINPQLATPSYQFYVSADPQQFQSLGEIFLNHPIGQVVRVN